MALEGLGDFIGAEEGSDDPISSIFGVFSEGLKNWGLFRKDVRP